MAVTVDFIAFDDERDACLMVLVEQGPWNNSADDHLRALQERLYGCLEAALDGHLAEHFPKAANKKVIVRVDCYDVPRSDVDEFMDRFSQGVAEMPDYSPEASAWVKSFAFEVTHDTVADGRA
jgi:hypothetical protein